MSEAAGKDVEKKKTSGNRGDGGKNKKKKERTLQEEVIELLRAEGFCIIPPADKKTDDKSKGKVKLSKNSKVPEIFKVIVDACKCQETAVLKLKKKKAKEKDLSSLENKAKQNNWTSANKKSKDTKENDTSSVNNTKEKAKEKFSSGTKNTENKAKKNLGSSLNSTKNKANENDPSIMKNAKKLNPKKEAKQNRNYKDIEKFVKKKKKYKKVKFSDITETIEEKKFKQATKSPKLRDNKNRNRIDFTFPKNIRKKNMLEILANQNADEGIYAKGYARINPKNSNCTYVSINDSVDILVSGVRDRNRAMDGDLVAVLINPEEDWVTYENDEVQKTGIVVCILEKIHLRKIVGTLELQGDRLRLKSKDQSVPTLVIDPLSVPEEVRRSPELYENTLFLANMSDWLTPYDCRGTIESIIGQVGDLEGETMAILLTNGLNVTPYDDKLTEGLPNSDYVPTLSDLEEREDWRKECVFTIDPATAVDLDDAVSCKKLPNGNYEIGVHISDVTHYLKAFTPLDEQVSERATTVYLVNTVYHMLPKSLCKLCSLLPGHEKLSFSVIWEMTPEAEVIKHRFAKTVIKSCYQMSYEKAQSMIDESSREWTKTDLPDLVGKYSPNDIRDTVNDLYKLSSLMRKRRFDAGALSIDQPKLQIILEKDTGIPISYRIEERQESNRLIEEFMLLANMTVAKHLYETMSDMAFLRIHGEPLSRILSRTSEDLGYLGVHLNTESSLSLQSSLSLYEKTGLDGYDEKFATHCRMMVIHALCAKSIPRANYTCSGMINDKKDLRHFALNVPFYTHFTSPIRRYADCVVHRLLFSSMTNSPLPNDWSADLCAKIAANCNGKKNSAKVAEEKSKELYFMDLLSRKGPTETMAVVMKIKKRCMDVILCYVGITIRLNYSDYGKFADIEYNKEHFVSTVIVTWKETGIVQMINVFSMINLRIEKHPKNYTIRGVLLPSRLNDGNEL